MVRMSLLCGAAALGIMAAPVAAQTVDPLAAKFGARENVRSISISPEGKQAVVVGPSATGGENAVVIDLQTGALTPIFSSKGRGQQITHCQFILEKRVVCTALFSSGTNGDFRVDSQLWSIASDGSEAKLLTAPESWNAKYVSHYGGAVIDYNVPGQPGSVLMDRWYAPETSTGTIVSRKTSGLGVEAVDVTTTRRKDYVTPRQTAGGFISDGLGHVRIIEMQPVNDVGYARRLTRYVYSGPQGGDWKPLSEVNFDSGLSKGFVPVAVDPDRNVAYGFDDKGGYTALYERALDGTGTTNLVLAKAGAEVDGLLQIGRKQRVVGASFVTDKRYAEYFDPELKKLSASLAKALGGDKQVGILDASADENRLVIYVGSDVDPGQYYLYDKTTHKLAGILPSRAELQGVPLATMRPVSFRAADGTVVPGYLTLPPGSSGKNLPAIVMPHGGPGARDEWGFDWLAQYFAVKGYAVFQPNFRGSTGYGTEFFGQNGFKGWRVAIGDVDDAGRWLVAQGIAKPDQMAIVGWSYGGYAALQSGVVDPGLYKAIVAIAPVTDFDKWREQFRDSSNYRIMDNLIGTGPHIAEGSPARHANAFTVPVLLFHGDADRNVTVGNSRLMKERLQSAGKKVDYVEYAGLDHQLDDAATRAGLLTRADAFLRSTMGIK